MKMPLTGPIRLACAECDREDFDGICQIPEDWEHVDEIAEIDSASVFVWWTHIGTCPDCQEKSP